MLVTRISRKSRNNGSLKDSTCRCRDYRARFAATRKLYRSRHARRKPPRLIRQLISTVGDDVGQSSICRLTISDHILRNSELETAITFVGFQLRFSQGRRAVAALRSHHRLPSMTGSRGRLQLRRFPCRCICLVQFSGEEESSRQITLRYNRKRIEFHRMASLPLTLIDPPQIKDRSRQQIVCGGICGREFFRAL